ncbi:2Fe-2S ferredoxin-type domain-containing protein [Dunaliella salina]|uniref:2Fe-2S ferredoxin n=1 Tax=Dunaliella salina TaxID=3046 RepID=A0ABQ7GBS6_DUNSA|nr:2Fe-2S ferredoxin-type domain-containing protein [Dunaliella salina]|eukprot:KAF5832066.1 2Fe-2S ferredoxin-type domain-containing protein [Dunaliella salina]
MSRPRQAAQLACSVIEAACTSLAPSLPAAPVRALRAVESSSCSGSSRYCGTWECSSSGLPWRAARPSYMHSGTVQGQPFSFAASPQQHMMHTSSSAAHGSGGSDADSEETISVVFVDKDGKDQEVRAPLGKNLLEVAHENEVDLEGACEGSLACSTCHVIVEDEEYYKRMPEPCDDELDMLDLAFELKETSRLGCQIIAAKELDGLRVRIPSATRNFYVDGHKPKPH